MRCGSEIEGIDCGSNGEWNASGVANVCTITNPTITGISLAFQKRFSIYFFLFRNRDDINGVCKLALQNNKILIIFNFSGILSGRKWMLMC